MTATIGIVSSIPYETSFQSALENNVSNVDFATPDDDENDVATNLANAVKDLVQRQVNYIVTLGGVNPYNAAADTNNNPSTKFFSLIGEIPASSAANCWGGVSLESWANNEKRVKYLISKGYDSEGAISLYYNQNSGMQSNEVDDWMTNLYPNFKTPQGKYVLVKTAVKAMKVDGANNENDFATTVNNIASAAVIVSAAPFMHKKHNKLVAALNNRQVNGNYIYVCYPLQNYAVAKPRKNYATVYTQTIEDGITSLAGVITAALSAKKAQSFKKQNPGSPKDIT
jgi:hypothetical protein